MMYRNTIVIYEAFIVDNWFQCYILLAQDESPSSVSSKEQIFVISCVVKNFKYFWNSLFAVNL